MHILIITPGFPEDENDTGCIPPMQIYFEQLKKNYPGIKISVISVHYPYLKSNYDWKGINVISCGAGNKKHPVRLYYWLKVIRYSLKINRELKVDLIHSFWLGEAAMLGNLVRSILKVKHINTMMGQDVKKTNRYLHFLPLKKIYKIALSKFHEDTFKASTDMKTDLIIPWGIRPITLNNQKRPYDIIGVGSLLPVKNYELFVRIIGEIKINYPNLKCLIIGEGIEREKIKHQIKKLNLNTTIKLTGQISREDVLDYMQQSKILLHTSNFESFGFVIVEALASGCYVVAKKIGCAEESKKLFIAETVEDFSDSIKNILNTEQNFVSEINYSSDKTVEAYHQLYLKFI